MSAARVIKEELQRITGYTHTWEIEVVIGHECEPRPNEVGHDSSNS